MTTFIVEFKEGHENQLIDAGWVEDSGNSYMFYKDGFDGAILVAAVPKDVTASLSSLVKLEYTPTKGESRAHTRTKTGSPSSN